MKEFNLKDFIVQKNAIPADLCEEIIELTTNLPSSHHWCS